MLSAKMQGALNRQIEHEFYSSFVYLAMSAHFEGRNLPGFAKWMRVQAGEEHTHAMKIFDHILDRGGEVVMPAIATTPTKWGAAIEVFQDALNHERAVTKSIHELYALAVEERDYPARVFLDWFVNEQVEEEKTAELVVEQLRMIGDDRPALIMLDRELAQRQPEAEGAGEKGS
ncbi:MAG TPA: ferritin [Gemmatimonadales bacterium]|nr:ferritin [Gemmatimonadales bacterium]